MQVSLKAMLYFKTAVARGSIAQAAAELNIAASAVAAAIDQVEEALALTLVSRQRSRGIAATASGRLIAQKFERLLEEYQAVLAEGAELKQSLSGVLRVGYYAPVAPAFLPGIFRSILPADSKTELHLQECDNDVAQEGLLNGDFDVILFVSEGARTSIDFDVLIKAPPYCLLPAGHPLAKRDRISLREIAQERLVVLDRPVAQAYYHQLFEDAGTSIQVAAYVNSTEMVRSLVASGHGCAVLNMTPLSDLAYSGDRLVSRAISDPLPPLTLSIAYHRARPRRVVQHFVDACRAYFADDGAARCIVEAAPTFPIPSS